MTDATPVTTTVLPLVPGRWALDANHARVGFSVRHLGVAKIRGHFAAVEAELVVGETPGDSSVVATIDVASLDTGNKDRDAHVLSGELLDVAIRPTMTFRSLGISGDGADWVLDGELTIGDVTQPVTLEVELGGTESFYDGVHAGFEARGEIRRHDFGIHFGPLDKALGNVVKLELDLEFLQPE
jgi:polyisoprenoid-binding protein YceI